MLYLRLLRVYLQMLYQLFCWSRRIWRWTILNIRSDHEHHNIFLSFFHNLDTNTEDWKKQMEITERPVELKEVVAVLNGVYGSTQNFNKDTFPIQQKLLLCSLLLILNKGRNKDITVGRVSSRESCARKSHYDPRGNFSKKRLFLFQLHEVYKKVCKKRNICAADFSEFLSMCLLIETRGTLRIVGKNQSRLSKVNLQWDQSELESALQDKNMMAEIINDTSCL